MNNGPMNGYYVLLDEYRNMMLTAMEFGYKQCEKGNNIQEAQIQFNKVFDKKKKKSNRKGG